MVSSVTVKTEEWTYPFIIWGNKVRLTRRTEHRQSSSVLDLFKYVPTLTRKSRDFPIWRPTCIIYPMRKTITLQSSTSSQPTTYFPPLVCLASRRMARLYFSCFNRGKTLSAWYDQGSFSSHSAGQPGSQLWTHLHIPRKNPSRSGSWRVLRASSRIRSSCPSWRQVLKMTMRRCY